MNVLEFLASLLRVLVSLPVMVFLTGIVPSTLTNLFYKPRYNYQFVDNFSSFVSWLGTSFITGAITLLTSSFFFYCALLLWPFGWISFLVLFIFINRMIYLLRANTNRLNITFY